MSTQMWQENGKIRVSLPSEDFGAESVDFLESVAVREGAQLTEVKEDEVSVLLVFTPESESLYVSLSWAISSMEI